MRGQGLNDLPRCKLERWSSHHKEIFFEVPNYIIDIDLRRSLDPRVVLPSPKTAKPATSRLASPKSVESGNLVLNKAVNPVDVG
jgi:hypothetical protein